MELSLPFHPHWVLLRQINGIVVVKGIKGTTVDIVELSQELKNVGRVEDINGMEAV